MKRLAAMQDCPLLRLRATPKQLNGDGRYLEWRPIHAANILREKGNHRVLTPSRTLLAYFQFTSLTIGVAACAPLEADISGGNTKALQTPDSVQATKEALQATGRHDDPDEEPVVPPNDVVTVELVDGKPVASHVDRNSVVQSQAAAAELDVRKPDSEVRAHAPEPKVSRNIPSTPTVNVLVRYIDNPDILIPRMPKLDPDQSPDSPKNIAVLERNARLIQRVESAREPDHARHGAKIRELGGNVKSKDWLINALNVTLPREKLDTLAQDPEVSYITSSSGDGTFFQASPPNTIALGRQIHNTDAYFSLSGINVGSIALLDSGVRRTHVVLAQKVLQFRDCVNGVTNNCGTAGPNLVLDPNDTLNHGTSVGDILGGSNALGNNFRGVTGQWIQSFKVGVAGAETPAVQRAFLASQAMGNAVINLSLGCFADDRACADWADSAFDSNSISVASMTNGGWGAIPVPTPAEGKKVLAVGAINSLNERWASSSGGPTPDGRTKPDLMGFGVFIESAGNASDTATRVESATSFATPYVAGATALMRRFLTQTNSNTEPGHTMAMMIASGDNATSPISNNGIGAGTVRMPVNGALKISKACVKQGTNNDISITVPTGNTQLKAALWWPEYRTLHNDIDLTVINASTGVPVGTSQGTPGIWEKVSASVSAGTTFTIRAKGFRVNSLTSHPMLCRDSNGATINGAQPVYFGVITQ